MGNNTEPKESCCLYEKAIEGRIFHYTIYNHWMNMYAIINGALFVGLYTAKSEKLKILVLFIGFISGWCWFLSVCGFYRWLISWINLVMNYEKKLSNNAVYQIFTPYKKPFPFSTQKITQLFTCCVALSWTISFCYKFFNSSFWNKFLHFLQLISINEKFRNFIFIAVVIIAFFALCVFFSRFLREDLTKTHKELDIKQK